MKTRHLFSLASGLLLALSQFAQAVDYDIVYSRFPRDGDENRIKMPEVFDPIRVPSGVDLMLLHPDGSEEVLVPGGDGAIIDPTVSYDGHWVYYSKFHDQRTEALDRQRPGDPSRAGADIYKIHLSTREIVRLTHQEWTPNTGLVDWSSDLLRADEDGPYYVGYGIFNLGPCPLPGGKVVFSSSRNTFLPNKGFTAPNLQLYTMDNDGGNVELMGHMNLGSALHPVVLTDGRVMFSSYEAQGLRDRRLWGLWAIWPDGRNWEPLVSAYAEPNAFHFQTELSNRHIAVVEYYNLNNNGFGTLLGIPPKPTDGPAFGSPDARDESNPGYQVGIWWFDEDHPSHRQPKYTSFPFSPKDIYNITAFTHGGDNASSRAQDGSYAGKVTHPSAAPDDDILLVWTPGPANNLNRPTQIPTYDAGIYILEDNASIDDHNDLVLIKNDPNYNEMQPRAVVPYSAVYGIDEPVKLPWYKNDGTEHAALPAGTPFGLVGTSSFYNRSSAPGDGDSDFDGLDPFNTSQNGASTNWTSQGADAGKYSDSEIFAVRILSMEPTTHLSRGPGTNNRRGFSNHAQERLRILGEIPLRKTNPDGSPLLDSTGMPDTSVLAKIPADVPFTFQTLDKDGLALNTSQTWHQLRPGEVRNDCGGCHAHDKPALDFAGTAASKPDYQLLDLLLKTPLVQDGEVTEVDAGAVEVEYYRDIKPILHRSCVTCHSVDGVQEASLALDDETVVDGYENTYNRLANDSRADYGIPPVISNGSWRQTNTSRYVRAFQSRRSLLAWKVFGRRLDGWTNDDHPTESVPGDASTLPADASANDADIDYLGTIMPPPDSGVPPLTEEEKGLFARWIDLGCPIDSPEPVRQAFGWFADELRPTLAVSLPAPGRTLEPLTTIRIGAFDYYTGLDESTLSVTADFEVNGLAPGTELAPGFAETGDHIWTLPLSPPITSLHRGLLTVSIKDTAGNITTCERTFTIGDVRLPPELVTGDGDGFGFRLEGEPQGQYRIESATDLFDWTPMLELQDFDGVQTIMELQEVNGRRFYRAVEME